MMGYALYIYKKRAAQILAREAVRSVCIGGEGGWCGSNRKAGCSDCLEGLVCQTMFPSQH
jgi:hypothetical protein